MIVFRMHHPRFSALDSTGAALFGGRWHSRGVHVVYTAEHVSLAVLETVVHASGDEIPLRSITRVEIPDDVSIEQAPWMELPGSQAFGGLWSQQMRTAVLQVPSVAVNGMESNFVLNPRHPDFLRIQCEPPREFLFDPRYFAQARFK